MSLLGLISPEARVLLASLSATREPRPVNRADALARADIRAGRIDWQRLAELTRREHAEIYARRWFDTVDEGHVPQDFRDHLQKVAMFDEFKAIAFREALGRTVNAVNAAGATPILLKGAALGVSAYPAFAERPIADLDLLVSAETSRAAWDALVAAGWVRRLDPGYDGFFEDHHHLHPLVDPAQPFVVLELHTELFPDTGAFALDADRLRTHAERCTDPGLPALLPSRIHAILYSALHFSWSHQLEMGTWRMLLDMQHLLDGSVDEDALVAEAVATRAATSLYWPLRLARSLADVDVSDTLLHRLAPKRSGIVLASIERHFTSMLFHDDTTRCPSARLERKLWEWAIEPERSGHGESRPWRTGDRFGEANRAVQPAQRYTQVESETGLRASRFVQLLRYVRVLSGTHAKR